MACPVDLDAVDMFGDGAQEHWYEAYVKKETSFFVNQCKLFNLSVFEAEEAVVTQTSDFAEINKENKSADKNFAQRYEMLKDQYGEIQSYYIKLIAQKLNKNEINNADNLIACVRSAMYSAKCIKDLQHDVLELKNSSNEVKFEYMNKKKMEISDFYSLLNFPEINLNKEEEIYNTLIQLLTQVQKNYNDNLNELYSPTFVKSLSDVEIATLMNFNRELFTSNKSMIMSNKFYLSDQGFLEKFGEIPTYQA